LRRAPLRRGKPLERRTRLRACRPTQRRSGRVRDAEYMDRVRGLPCLCRDFLWEFGHDDVIRGCSGADTMHAHHMGVRGLGQKCSDLATVPFCERHHRDWHECTGPFAGKSKEWRAEFSRAAIEATKAVLR